jgi:hypothetical protein
LRLAGWATNCVDPHTLFPDANIDTTRFGPDSQYEAPLIGTIP